MTPHVTPRIKQRRLQLRTLSYSLLFSLEPESSPDAPFTPTAEFILLFRGPYFALDMLIAAGLRLR